MKPKAGRAEIINWDMREGYSEAEIYKRLLDRVDAGSSVDNVQLRFIAKAFSYEMALLWNGMDKMAKRILSAPYLVPPSLLAAPVAYQVRCRLLYGANLSELDKEDLFVADNGMSFTVANRQDYEDGTVILENVEYRRTVNHIDRQNPVFSIEIPANKELLWIKVPGAKVKRVFGGDRVLEAEWIMSELISRLSLLPVIKEGFDSDLLSPHCKRIVDELAFVCKRMKRIRIENESVGMERMGKMSETGAEPFNGNRVFFTVDNKCCSVENGDCDNSSGLKADDEMMTIAADYALCSTGRLERGAILKCSKGCFAHSVAAEVADTVCCRYDEADFGAAFRYTASWKRIWSLSDIRDSSLSLFPHVLKDVSAVRGSFVKQGMGAVSGIIVKLCMKESVGSHERDFWRTKVAEFLKSNSPSTYNYMVLAK